MRYPLLLIFSALLAFYSSAACAQSQDPESVKLALAYHERCLYNVYTERSISAREAFCGCTAERALANLSEGELRMMATGKGTAIDEKRLAIDIETPCLSYVLSDYEFEECYYKREFEHLFASLQAYTGMCRCVGDHLGQFVDDHGQLLMEITLDKYKSDRTPLDKLLTASDYRREKSVARSTCMSRYARR